MSDCNIFEDNDCLHVCHRPHLPLLAHFTTEVTECPSDFWSTFLLTVVVQSARILLWNTDKHTAIWYNNIIISDSVLWSPQTHVLMWDNISTWMTKCGYMNEEMNLNVWCKWGPSTCVVEEGLEFVSTPQTGRCQSYKKWQPDWNHLTKKHWTHSNYKGTSIKMCWTVRNSFGRAVLRWVLMLDKG